MLTKETGTEIERLQLENNALKISVASLNQREVEMEKSIEDLRQSEKRSRLLVASVKDYAIFMLDPEGYITSWNDGAQRIKGYTAEEIIGKHFSIFYTKEDLDNGKPSMELEVAKAVGKYEEEGVRLRKDGTKIWVNVIITAVYSEEHELIGFAKVTRDLSERKEAEEALVEKNRELVHSNSELEQFAYVASHDLKEPLRMVSSYVQLLSKRLETRLDEESKEYIQFAMEGAQRMNVLISDLLEYSRVGRMYKLDQKVDLNEAIDTVEKNLRTFIQESGATINHQQLPTVLSAQVYMVQLFQNLINNSIKFARIDVAPEIDITVSDYQGFWLFIVRDNGIGFDQKHADRIFIIFQRLHERGSHPGTGIGLAICKKIIEIHGGRIWAESEIGVGTKFLFTLPK
jgi:PAS domain S-box-containing protein